jgi:2',3'-cyclic-nucleotide 2'-phosphodiesterase/3'-nucleotidase
MTGEEIRKHLEMSYDLWVNTMTSPDDHIMMIDTRTVNDNQRAGFKNMTFNFDSAVGIDYEVDVTKPDGEKVNIIRMSNGEKFEKDKWYKVVMNSYRGNGGGELLTKGVGLSKEEIERRIIWKSERDQRYYLIERIKREKTITPTAHNNWRFVPEDWAKPAIERDKKILFGR